MKKLIPLLTSLFVAFALSSCSKPTHESLSEDMIGQMEELLSVLGELPKDEDEKLKKKYGDRMSEVMSKLVSVSLKLHAKPEVYKIIEEPMKGIGK